MIRTQVVRKTAMSNAISIASSSVLGFKMFRCPDPEAKDLVTKEAVSIFCLLCFQSCFRHFQESASSKCFKEALANVAFILTGNGF